MDFRFLAFNWTELSKGDLSLLTTLAGLVIVFAVLIILTLVISLLKKMGASSAKMGDKKGNESKKTPSFSPMPPVQITPPVSKSVQTPEDDSLIAVIAAAVHAFGESIGQTLAVKSVQRTTRKSKDSRSAWATAGVRENTTSF